MTNIRKIITECDNRYLSADEERRVLDIAEKMPARIAAMREIEKNERAAANVSLKAIQKKYKSFPKYHDMAWDKTLRDSILISRLVAQATLLGDGDYMNDKALFWFRTIIKSFGLTPDFVRDVYGELREAYRKILSEESFALAEPYLDQVVEVLSDFPEPAMARV